MSVFFTKLSLTLPIAACIHSVLCYFYPQYNTTLSLKLYAERAIGSGSRTGRHWELIRKKNGKSKVWIPLMLLSSSLLSVAQSSYISSSAVIRKATVVQVISGISYATYSTSSNYTTALKSSIAACMTGVSASDIVDLVVASRSSSAAVHSNIRKMQVTAASDSISASYDISSSSSSITYTRLISELTTAISDSTFSGYLANYSVIYSAPGFANCTATLESTTDTTNADDEEQRRPFSKDAVAGLVILGMIVLCCMCVASIYYCTHTPERTHIYAVAPAPAIHCDVEMGKQSQPASRIKTEAVPMAVGTIANAKVIQEESS